MKYYVVSCRVTPIVAASGEIACRKIERLNPRHGALLGRSVAVESAFDAELILGLVGGTPGRTYSVVSRRRRAKKAKARA